MTGISSRVTHILLLLVVSVGCAFIISPGLYGQHLPELRATDIGQPYRAASPSGFKATRDYDIVHSETTEQRRLEARAAVRPVFDYDPSTLNALRTAVDE